MGDATHFLITDGMKSTMTMSPGYLHWWLFGSPEMHPRLIPFVEIFKGLSVIAYGIAALRQWWEKHNLKEMAKHTLISQDTVARNY